MSNDPIDDPVTAYWRLEEKRYKAEMELAERYQAFTAELLRLALLGIAAFGFLYKEAFLEFDASQHPDVNILAAKSRAACGIALFGLTSILALLFRYCSSETVRLYLEGLRYTEAGAEAKAAQKLLCRGRLVYVCMASKAGAALFLASGAALTSWAFLELLR